MSIQHPVSNAPTPISSGTPSRLNSGPSSTSLSYNPTESVGDVQRLTSQIRAFLAASEDVDIDVETVEDLMNAFPESAGEVLNGNAANNENQNDTFSEVEVDLDDDGMEPDTSALFSSRETAIQTWSPMELRHMMRHLKENGMQSWVNEYVHLRKIPIQKLLCAFGINLCPGLENKSEKTMLYFLRVAMFQELRLREKLPQYSTVDDAVQLIQSSKRIIILTGAGISVSCGIPDFRSRNGLYASLKENGDYELDDPQQMFDIDYFRENPSVFYSFASQIYPSNFVPSPCHRFIKLVEDRGKLLRNYTQNIDTLETLAGVKNVLQCHGSFATATCIQCRTRVDGSAIEADIMKRRVPLCRVCNLPGEPEVKASAGRKPKAKSKKKQRGEWDSEEEDQSDGPEYPPGIMKPDITFFGEKLTSNFDHSLEKDRSEVDLLIVIGTSLKVAPVSDILYYLPHSVPQILINKTPVRHINPDVILLGDADTIVQHLCEKLSWVLPPVTSSPSSQPSSKQESNVSECQSSIPTMRFQPPRGNGNLKKREKRSFSDVPAHQEPQRVGNSHIWLFSGAEGGKWLEDLLAVNVPNDTDPPGIPMSQADNCPREAKKQKTR